MPSPRFSFLCLFVCLFLVTFVLVSCVSYKFCLYFRFGYLIFVKNNHFSSPPLKHIYSQSRHVQKLITINSNWHSRNFTKNLTTFQNSHDLHAENNTTNNNKKINHKGIFSDEHRTYISSLITVKRRKSDTVKSGVASGKLAAHPFGNFPAGKTRRETSRYSEPLLLDFPSISVSLVRTIFACDLCANLFSRVFSFLFGILRFFMCGWILSVFIRFFMFSKKI